MKALFIVSLLFLDLTDGKAQDVQNLDSIDIVVHSLDSTIINSTSITSSFIKGDENPFYRHSRYIHDTLNGHLLKVIQILPFRRSEKNRKGKYVSVIDTIQTSFYFFNDSLIKVVHGNLTNKLFSEYYFTPSLAIYKKNPVNTKPIIVEIGDAEAYLDMGKQYLQNFKAHN
jgi:hypothetical protein